MRSGCLDLAIRIIVSAVAAIFTVLGAVLLLSVFFSPAQVPGVEGIAKVLVAFVAAYAFYVVGKSIWRDIKSRQQPPEEPKDHGSSG